jgi:hypothetical protein
MTFGSCRHENLHPTGKLIHTRLEYVQKIIVVGIRRVATLVERVNENTETTTSRTMQMFTILTVVEWIHQKAIPELDYVEVRIGEELS